MQLKASTRMSAATRPVLAPRRVAPPRHVRADRLIAHAVGMDKTPSPQKPGMLRGGPSGVSPLQATPSSSPATAPETASADAAVAVAAPAAPVAPTVMTEQQAMAVTVAGIAYSIISATIASQNPDRICAALTLLVVTDNLRHTAVIPPKSTLALALAHAATFAHLVLLPYLLTLDAPPAVAIAMSVAGIFAYKDAAAAFEWNELKRTYTSTHVSGFHVLSPMTTVVTAIMKANELHRTELVVLLVLVTLAQGGSVRLPYPARFFLSNGMELVYFWCVKELFVEFQEVREAIYPHWF